MALLNAALVRAVLPEPRRPGAADHSSDGVGSGGWTGSLAVPAVRQLAAVGMLVAAATMAMETVSALFSQRSFGWGVRENGWAFASIGAVAALVQLGLVGRLADRFGSRRMLLAVLFLLAAGFALLPAGGGTGLVSPTVPTLLSLAAPPATRGAVLGLAQGVAGVGRLFGPLAAGGLFALSHGLAFFADGALCLAGLLVAMPRRSTARAPSRSPT